jgi:predicted ATPase
MASEIVGRDAELASLHAFTGEAEGQAAALVLEGEAGIGKSTLWEAGVEHARAKGLRVLTSRPADAERSLGYAGLADLLEALIDDVLPALLTPRRRALQVALVREEASGDPVDRRTLAVAVRDVLQVLGERGPTMIAIDDVQWLDPSSSRALAFAVRRLDANPVSLFLARRLGESAHQSELERALGADRVRRLAIGPLSVGALHRLLRDRQQRPFARQTLLRIHERSGANPFFALEPARILPEDVDPLEPLPVPETLDELLGTRISALPASTRKALALAAALGLRARHLALSTFTSCSARTFFGSSRGSSSGASAGHSQRSTPPAPATSGSSTASRGTRTTYRARGSPRIVVSSSSLGTNPREP